VIPLPSITPVPNTKEFIVGVFNLRGEIFPLVDISTILGMEAKPIKGSDMVIVLDGKSMTVGILVDRIHGVRTLDNVQVKPAHGIVSRQMEEFVSSVISEKSSVIYLLEIDRLFSTSLIRTYY
jgi:purine-binding chemotaxis protein CheW